MTVAVRAVLLAACAALGCLPAAARALADGAGVFTSPAVYRDEVLGPVAAHGIRQRVTSAWTTEGLLLGFASTGLAVLLAGIAVWAPRRRNETVHAAVTVVRRLHSGRLGDHLAWLALGIAVLCAALAAQT
jgi:multicomponent Na+:H+ antiporter subunit D